MGLCIDLLWVPTFKVGSHIINCRLRAPSARVGMIYVRQHHVEGLARGNRIRHDVSLRAYPDIQSGLLQKPCGIRIIAHLFYIHSRPVSGKACANRIFLLVTQDVIASQRLDTYSEQLVRIPIK